MDKSFATSFEKKTIYNVETSVVRTSCISRCCFSTDILHFGQGISAWFSSKWTSISAFGIGSLQCSHKEMFLLQCISCSTKFDAAICRRLKKNNVKISLQCFHSQENLQNTLASWMMVLGIYTHVIIVRNQRLIGLLASLLLVLKIYIHQQNLIRRTRNLIY